MASPPLEGSGVSLASPPAPWPGDAAAAPTRLLSLSARNSATLPRAFLPRETLWIRTAAAVDRGDPLASPPLEGSSVWLARLSAPWPGDKSAAPAKLLSLSARNWVTLSRALFPRETLWIRTAAAVDRGDPMASPPLEGSGVSLASPPAPWPGDAAAAPTRLLSLSARNSATLPRAFLPRETLWIRTAAAVDRGVAMAPPPLEGSGVSLASPPASWPGDAAAAPAMLLSLSARSSATLPRALFPRETLWIRTAAAVDRGDPIASPPPEGSIRFWL